MEPFLTVLISLLFFDISYEEEAWLSFESDSESLADSVGLDFRFLDCSYASNAYGSYAFLTLLSLKDFAHSVNLFIDDRSPEEF